MFILPDWKYSLYLYVVKLIVKTNFKPLSSVIAKEQTKKNAQKTNNQEKYSLLFVK